MMIEFNLTPVSGSVIINGEYTYDESLTDDEYRGKTLDFHLELTWDSDMLVGTSINRIIWQDDIQDEKKEFAEALIRDTYSKLNKKVIVTIKD